MLIVIICIFIIAALLGLYLLSFIFQNKNTPKGIAFSHGPIAAIGIILLIIYTIIYIPKPLISLLIFILAALGGFLLIYRDLTGQSLPKWLAIGHGVIALMGFLLLLLFTFFS